MYEPAHSLAQNAGVLQTARGGDGNAGSPGRGSAAVSGGEAKGDVEAFADGHGVFRPRPPRDLAEAGLNDGLVESLVLKFLSSLGVASGRRIAHELGLPYAIFPEFLRQLQNRKLITLSNTATANDFDYALTDSGRARAMAFIEECAYVGTAPVPFAEYVKGVKAQSITLEHPGEADLRRAFAELLITPEMFRTLGPAINSGQGMFLFGAPGNGKTSIAERITRCFGRTIWIPRVIEMEGQLVKLFDQACHEPVAAERSGLLRPEGADGRWVEIKRPTIVAGGELTMENLEIGYDKLTRVSEASFQLKANNGTFLIDDLGRQKMTPNELLNRWIVPLEKRFDYLALANGKKLRVPFDQLIIFSTNIEPSKLVDEAFLRRIPFKIRTVDPSEAQFRQLFSMYAPRLGFAEVPSTALDRLVERHYRQAGRPFRCCQPRDLLLLVRNYCIYNKVPMTVRPDYLDFAVENYFSASTFSS
jgi:predicted ATPase with chaperone activity